MVAWCPALLSIRPIVDKTPESEGFQGGRDRMLQTWWGTEASPSRVFFKVAESH